MISRASTDKDPDHEDSADQGLTYYRDVPLVGVFSHSAVYQETIRESFKPNLIIAAGRTGEPEILWDVQSEVKLLSLGVVAHEIGHGPRTLTDEMLRQHGVDPEDPEQVPPREGDEYDVHQFEQGLMQEGAERIHRATFRPRTLLRFRLAGSWCTRNVE